MRYSDIKDDWKNISRCVSFRIIEEVVDYNQGIMFEEYTRTIGIRCKKVLNIIFPFSFTLFFLYITLLNFCTPNTPYMGST